MAVEPNSGSAMAIIDTEENQEYSEEEEKRMIQEYLMRIHAALQEFCSSYTATSHLGRSWKVEGTDKMDVEMSLNEDNDNHEVVVESESVVTPTRLAQLLLEACDLSGLAQPVQDSTLPDIPPIQRDCDLPPDQDDPLDVPYQRRRVDYLRDILRAMAPLQLDVAAQVCTLFEDQLEKGLVDETESKGTTNTLKGLCRSTWLLFSVWLPVAPQVAPLASHLFHLSAFGCPLNPEPQDPLERFTLMEATHQICQFVMTVRLDYRELITWWNWSPVFDWLLQDYKEKKVDRMDQDEPEPYEYNPNFTWQEATLWHTVRTLAYVLNLTPAAKAEYIQEHFEAIQYAERVPWAMHPWTVNREETRTQQLALQGRATIPWAKRPHNPSLAGGEEKNDEDNDHVFDRPDAAQIRQMWPLRHPYLVECGGQGRVLVRYHLDRIRAATTTASNQGRLVHTPTTCQNLNEIARALCIDPYPPPILVCGKPGAGKSSLVRELARMIAGGGPESRHDDYLLELHVDDETDTKTLVGCCTTTDIPGEFVWRPGALTVAVREGKWVLMEDLDTVPLDVQASLVRLLKDRVLPLGNGKVEPCHANFRMFATTTTDSSAGGTVRRQGRNKVFEEHLWIKVEAKPLPMVELKDIAIQTQPSLPEFVVEAVLGIFEALDQSGRDAMDDGADDDKAKPNSNNIQSENKHMMDQLSSTVRHVRPPSVRDLFKVMARIAHSVVWEKSSGVLYSTEQQRLTCLAETFDAFAAACPDPETRREFVRWIAAPKWNLTADLALRFLQSRSPDMQQHEGMIQIGRVGLSTAVKSMETESGNYTCTGYTLRMMESIGVCIRENAPVLLVGETGGGKTSILQQLARVCGHTLVVQNLSLQTDSTDLLGGFQPLEIRQVAHGIYHKFVDLFTSSFSRKQNEAFLNFTSSCLKKKQWAKLADCFQRAAKMGLDKMKARLKVDSGQQNSVEKWVDFLGHADRFQQQQRACETGLAFAFREGILVEALKEGHWILLDEINLASSETLQRLCGLLDDSTSSLTLTERGDSTAVQRHPNFRLFAAMNPATDAGKKDLPPSIRARFTELHVDEILEPLELRLISGRYIGSCLAASGTAPENTEVVANVVNLYLESRSLAEGVLVDGAGHKPRYSLRSFTRALTAAKTFVSGQKLSLQRALLEGFDLTFQGSLDAPSTKELGTVLEKYVGCGLPTKERDHPGRNPGGRGRTDEYVLVSPFWIEKGPQPCIDWSKPAENALPQFILTPTTKKNLRRLGRAIAAGPWPILLEGPTSAGKTSLVEYCAAVCGHKVVRINNHEHTDIQEYTGGFAPDENGNLGYKDGLLVRALRSGHWVILDELNLAPTEVLEALNRLLDDNRELCIAETNEVIRPHPAFRLFATQNPSGAYGGRKPLSRAFRNRFLEIYVGDIPPSELVTILEMRAGIAPSYAKILVSVMKSFRQHRSATSVFLGKDGIMTARDLLRWAHRGASSKLELAREGYMLLAERLRMNEEKARVQREIEKQFKVQVKPDLLYYDTSSEARKMISNSAKTTHGLKIAPTKSMLRLMTLILRCMNRHEPILLVGDTGCGKTTVVQLIAEIQRSRLRVVNCHATTETSDLIGGMRPVRGRSELSQHMLRVLRNLIANVSDSTHIETCNIPEFVSAVTTESKDLTDDDVSAMVDTARALKKSICGAAQFANPDKKRQKLEANTRGRGHTTDASNKEVAFVEECTQKIERLFTNYRALFEWSDGPLVQAMKKGDMILLDEISLAEDAVLERLNSVLEPGRTLVLAERGVTEDDDETNIVARDGFQIFATMNPGGDFGKRELSPALRSRFTEIWVPPVTDMSDIELVLTQSLEKVEFGSLNASEVVNIILGYVDWFNNEICGDTAKGFSEMSLSLRDIKTWADFIEASAPFDHETSVSYVLYQGACLMHLDGLGLGTALSQSDSESVKKEAEAFLRSRLGQENNNFLLGRPTLSVADNRFGIHPFHISLGPVDPSNVDFNFNTPTVSSNLARILRGMQMSKPILLEGSPGVGKTTLIEALAKTSGHPLVRINLSEQTDMTDLLGSDMPVSTDDNTQGGSMFKWIDGALLAAVKAGHWVLLDELNLASQSVLEGLNSILDHRASVFIPEIGKTIFCPPSFRVFAAQNPLGQGGGRKGLPKSFLNRFVKVYVDALKSEDQLYIIANKFRAIQNDFVQKMVACNNRIHQDVVENMAYGSTGSPWEFNLRDLIRWCQLISMDHKNIHDHYDEKHVRDIYIHRLRTQADREKMRLSFQDTFGEDNFNHHYGVHISRSTVTVGDVTLPRIEPNRGRTNAEALKELRSILDSTKSVETVARCVERNWPCLLVGSASSMKEEAISTLARLMNATIVDIDLSPSSDVSELLGSFEQIDEGYATLEQLEALVGFGSYRLVENPTKLQPSDQKRSELMLNVVQRLFKPQNYGCDDSASVVDLCSWLMELSGFFEDKDLTEMKKLFESMQTKNVQRPKARFEWKDGPLVHAMTEGKWVHLRHANLCPSSVLDRLNSVLEPNGHLLLLECSSGSADGADRRIVEPHPNFRVFLTMDDEAGEVSRAMRNRCVEVCFDGESSSQLRLVDRTDSVAIDGVRCLETVEFTGENAPFYSRFFGRLICSDRYRAIQSPRHTKPVRRLNIMVPSIPSTSRRTLDWPFRPSWAQTSWAFRLVQHFNGTEAADFRLLAEMVPSSMLPLFDRVMRKASAIHSVQIHMISLILLDPLAFDGNERNCFLNGLDHSIRRSSRHIYGTILSDKSYHNSSPATTHILLELIDQSLRERIWESRPSSHFRFKSVLLTSRLLHEGKVDRNAVECPVTPLVLPFFQRFNEWWKSTESRQSGKLTSASDILFAAQRRGQLWNLLERTAYCMKDGFIGFDLPEFVVQWVWLRKTMKVIGLERSSQETCERLNAVMTNIDRVVFGGESFHCDQQTVKWPVRPVVPRTPDTWNTWLSLKDLGQVLSSQDILKTCIEDPKNNIIDVTMLTHDRHQAILGVSSLKTEFLGVTSMFLLALSSMGKDGNLKYFLQRGKDMVKLINTGFRRIQSEFLIRLDALRYRLDAEMTYNQPDLETQHEITKRADFSFEADDSYATFFNSLLRQYGQVQLSPLIESSFREEEIDIVRMLCRSKTAAIAGRPVTAEHVKLKISSLIKTGLSSCWINPADIAAHQSLLWALEEKGFETIQGHDFFRELLGQMIFSCLMRVWTGPSTWLKFTSFDMEIPLELIAQIEFSKKRKHATAENHSIVDITTKTVLLFIGGTILSNPPKNAALTVHSIENYQARNGQAVNLIKHLASVKKHTPDQHWETLYLLQETIHALNGSIGDDSASISQMVDLLVEEASRRSSDEVFDKLVDSVMRPLVSTLKRIMSMNQTSHRQDWSLVDVYVGQLRFHLRLPRSILDPGQKPIAKVDLLERQISSIESQIAASILYQHATAGSTHRSIIHEQSIKNLRTKMTKQRDKIIVRSEPKPSFAELHHELHSFGKAFLDQQKLQELAEILVQGSNKQLAISRVRNLLLSWEAFCKRCTHQFQQFDDIVSPLVGSVSLVARGFDDLVNSVSDCKSFDLTGPMKACFSFPRLDCLNHRVLWAGVPVASSRTEWSCIFPLAISELFRVLVVSKTEGLREFTGRSWSQIVKAILSSVELRRLGVTTNKIPARTDHDVAEEKFREVFPDHRRAFSAASVDNPKDTLETPEIIDEQSFSPSLSPEDSGLLAWLHSKIFSPCELSCQDRLKWFHFSYRAASEICHTGYFDQKLVNPAEFVPAHIMAISLNTPRCYFKSTGLTVENIPGEYEEDFQSYPNSDEAIKLSLPLEGLMGQVGKLLALFPGNDVLVSLLKVTDRVRKLDALRTSVAALLVGLEEILKHAQDWEQHASVRVQIGKPLGEVRRLVADLRKLELASWPMLLLSREKHHERESRKHWIRLHIIFEEFLSSKKEGMVGQTPPIENSVTTLWTPKWALKGLVGSSEELHLTMPASGLFAELVKTLDTFILTSSRAEIKQRLLMLRAFAIQFKTEARFHQNRVLQVLSRTVLSLCEYYQQFSSYLSHCHAEMRRPYEEKLKNETKMAKWDLQSYYALVDTSERNHRKLMGILNDYDETLLTSASLLLEKERNRGIANEEGSGDSQSPTLPPTTVIFPFSSSGEQMDGIEEKVGEKASPKQWRAAKPGPPVSISRISKMPLYAERMKEFANTIKSDTWALKGAEAADDLSGGIFERIEALRSKNAARSMKERALVDLFRELKRNGYSFMKWSVPEEFRKFAEILHLPSPLNVLKKESVRFELIKSSEDYFLRSLLEMNGLRPESNMNKCRDLTKRQTEMMLGYSEHCVYITVQQRSLVSSLLHNLADLSSTVKSLEFPGSSLAAGSVSLEKTLSRFESLVGCALEGVQQLLLMVKASLHMMDESTGRLWASTLIEQLSAWSDNFGSDSLPICDRSLVTTRHFRDIRRCRTKLCTARDILQKGRTASRGLLPDLCFSVCIEKLESAISCADACAQRTSNGQQVDEDKQKEVASRFEQLCTDTIESALLRTQECLAEEDETDFIWSCHKKASLQLLGIHVTKLTSSCQAMVRELQELNVCGDVNEETLVFISSLSADVSRICHESIKVIQRRLDHYITFFRSCTKLSYIIIRVFRTLIARGFCSEQVEESSAGDGAGGLTFGEDTNGTGMGEGEGRIDVTDEIENEEQLLGTKHDHAMDETAQKPPQELDKDEAEKGMEIENDFDGEMHDVPDPHDDEGKEDEEDEKEELDREMGDEPGLNDQVVDEKLWDGDDDEENAADEKEKVEEGSAVKGQKSDEIVSKETNGNDEEEQGNADESPVQDENMPENPQDDSNQNLVNDDDADGKEDSHGVDVRNEREVDNNDDDIEFDDNLDFEEDKQEDIDDENAVPDEEMENLASTSEKLDDMNESKEETMPEDTKEEDEEGEDCPERESAVQLGGADENERTEEQDSDGEEQRRSVPQDDLFKSGLGVQNVDGNDLVEDDVDDDDMEGGRSNENKHEMTDEQEQEHPGQGGSGAATAQGSTLSNGAQSESQTQVPEILPNPLQNLGDAKKFWHQRLNIVKNDERGDVADHNDQNDPDQDDEGRGDYEHAKENEKWSTQTLGATEEDVKADELELNQSETERNTERRSKNSNERGKSEAGRAGQKSQRSDTSPENIETETQESETEVHHESPTKEDEKDDDEVSEKILSKTVADLSKLNVVDGSIDMDNEHSSIVQDEDMLRVSDLQYDEAKVRWGTMQREVYPLARRLCEKLRLVMEPLVASKLQGDYRTGKRINMKRVIGYIASSYRKDKIWLRRTKPARRNYRVLVAVDDSESMTKSGTGEMALRAMATLAMGMSQLEIGEIGIASFGDEMQLVHPFNQPFTSESGIKVTSCFQFKQQRTRTAVCVESAMMALIDEPYQDIASMQIVFLISDGRIERDSRATLRRLIREMLESNILMAMIIVEGSEKAKDSIVNMKEITFVEGKPKVKAFIEDFPFPYYIVLDDMSNLPAVLGDALRQWFEMLTRLQNH